ncbi:rhodanese-like domain-containing protein [Rhodoluna limnophila]|jgi:rhodanese-related sulfurtransferase|uniref:rhodanese-like domain-containing protein n=1 Tax=Rhodoluna limnophila TaxID=232537 RepID=UPI001106B74B|nr:rhodanese-like domain-containing protein [Rhodoluna limnophila]
MGLFGNLFKKKFETVSPARAKEMQLDGALLVDVRESHEYKSGHAAGAKHIPLGSVQNRLSDLPLEREILVICQSGARSAQAAAFLAGKGYKVTNVSGGTANWRRQGLSMSK